MDIVVFLTVLAGLFLVIGFGEPIAARLRLPFTVFLAIAGIIAGAAAGVALRSDLTDLLDPVASTIVGLPVSSRVFLYVFLPTLLFQVALTLNLRRLLDDLVAILTLAILAVVITTFAIGAALAPFAAQPLVICLLVGAIVATTDPSAVVGIFREIGAPRRLGRLVEGESLLNDAAAIALFGLFVGLAPSGASAPGLGPQAGAFALQLLGGGAVGYAIARLLVVAMDRFRGQRLAQVSLSLALPYVTYIAAEQFLGASGVLAVVAAGMTFNLLGPARLPPQNWQYLRETWELLAHWTGSLIFILAALVVPRLLDDVGWSDLGLVGVVVAAATAARAVTLFGVLPVLERTGLSRRIGPGYRIVILWGGLRGAMTLALTLAVSENPALPEETRRFVVVLATGFTLFTLLVQGTTLRAVIRWTRIDRLPPIERALQSQVQAVALQTVREEMAETARRYELTHSIVRSEAKRFAARLDEAVQAAEKTQSILDRDRLTLGLVTLAGREREMILEGFRERIISTALIERMLSDAARLIERTRQGGRSDYRRAAREGIGYGRRHRLAYFLHRRLRISGPLAALAADRFEILLITRMLLRDLHDFIDTKIRRIHGRRVAELLHEVLKRRAEEVDREVAGMQLQYPGFAEQLERGFLRKAQLRIEEREIESAFDDGLIGADLHQSLMRELRARRRAIDIRPRIDMSLHKREMLQQFPLFAALPERRQRRLARTLVTIFAEPGEMIIRRGRAARAVFFIASGAVERELRGTRQRLGRGEMFGEIALLRGQRNRRGQVRAITHCTLLRLDEARFLRLLARYPELRAQLVDSAVERGMSETSAERMVAAAAAAAGTEVITELAADDATAENAAGDEAADEAEGAGR